MFGILNNEEIEKVMKAHSIGRIGCHSNEKMYVVPISYVYDNDCIYCHSHEGLKINIMRQNPKVCFEVDTLENLNAWKSAIAWGEFEEIKNEDERKAALKLMLDKALPFTKSKTMKMELGSNYPFAPDDLSKIHGIVFKIKLHEKTGRFELNDNKENYLNG
jgi:nitroimidazol reductase NimA-like FMN-containing flavoprotein (pyridoxamine 5'-phosphate oxidase superfamily)